jgi:hypothetical protein
MSNGLAPNNESQETRTSEAASRTKNDDVDVSTVQSQACGAAAKEDRPGLWAKGLEYSGSHPAEDPNDGLLGSLGREKVVG